LRIVNCGMAQLHGPRQSSINILQRIGDTQ